MSIEKLCRIVGIYVLLTGLFMLMVSCSDQVQTKVAHTIHSVDTNTKQALQPWTGGLVPKLPAGSGPVNVVDCSGDTSQGNYACRAIEGIVNRSGGNVYVIGNNNTSADKFWITATNKFNGRGATYLTLGRGANPGLDALYTRYQSSIQEFNVYDISKDWTFGIAMTRAGITNGVPVTLSLERELAAIRPKTVVDYSTTGTNRITGYEWALKNLMPHVGKQVVFVFKDGNNNPGDNNSIFDYAIALRAFTFSMAWDYTDQQQEISKVLAHYKQGTLLLGYYPCQIYADCFSSMATQNGLYGVAADYFANASLWSSFPSQTGFTQPSGLAVQAQKNKLYVTLYSSDGDNLPFNQHLLYPWWQDTANAGSIAMGYSIDPLLIEIAPPLFQWIYANRPVGTELMGGPSGLGFPDSTIVNNASLYTHWLTDDARYMRAAGLTDATLWNLGRPNSSNIAEYFAYHPDISGAFLEQYGTLQKSFGAHQIVSGSNLAYSSKVSDIQNDLASLPLNPDAPTFVAYQVSTDDINQNLSKVKNMVTSLDTHYPGKIVWLNPRDYAATVEQYLNPYPDGKIFADFDTRGNSAETAYLYQQSNSRISNDHRSTNGRAYMTYKLTFPLNTTYGIAQLTLGGHFTLQASTDNTHWTDVSEAPFVQTDSTSPDWKKTRILDLNSFLINNVAKTVYLKFTDATGQGNGAALWHIRAWNSSGNA